MQPKKKYINFKKKKNEINLYLFKLYIFKNDLPFFIDLL